MATIKLSELPSATLPLSGGETVIMNQGAATVLASLSSVVSYNTVSDATTSENYGKPLKSTDNGGLSLNTVVAIQSVDIGASGVSNASLAITHESESLVRIFNNAAANYQLNFAPITPALSAVFVIAVTYADDTAAASAGLAVGDVYFTGTKFRVRTV